MNTIQFKDQVVADLLDALPQPVFWMIPVRLPGTQEITDFEYSYCNNEMFQYTGLSTEQLIGKRISTTLTLKEEHKKDMFREILEVYRTGQKMQGTLFNPVLNKYYSFLRSKVLDGVLTVIQDRTTEYKMIGKLEQQKSLLDNILKHSPSGISVTEFIRDEKGSVQQAVTNMANEAALRFSGVRQDSLQKKTTSGNAPLIFGTPFYHRAVDTLETGVPFHTQYFLESGDRWLDLSVARLDKDQIIQTFTDITETKKAQLEMERSADRLRTVFHASQAGMFTLTPVYEKEQITDFRFVLVNEAVAAYVGEKSEHLTGALASIYFPAYKTNGLFEKYVDTFLHNTIHDFEFHYEDGYDVFFNIHTVKTGDEVLVTFTDHTALKRLQRELEFSIQELKRSNQNLEEFAYAASHDLKEPIRKIHFFSERLKKQYQSLLDEEGLHTFERMESATQRMQTLVDDLLSYSQVSLRPRTFEHVDLVQVIISVLSDLELEIEERKAIIRYDQLPVIKGHMRQLQQLFQNLVGNALKYARAGTVPHIEIHCTVVPGRESGIGLPEHEVLPFYYAIDVTDQGIGFEQKDAERIFNVFQRLHGNSEYSGTGVGLSIARKVAENHKGTITATAQPGRGARFRVLLPKTDNGFA